MPWPTVTYRYLPLPTVTYRYLPLPAHIDAMAYRYLPLPAHIDAVATGEERNGGADGFAAETAVASARASAALESVPSVSADVEACALLGPAAAALAAARSSSFVCRRERCFSASLPPVTVPCECILPWRHL